MKASEWLAGLLVWCAVAAAAWYMDTPGEVLVVTGAAGLCVADLVEGWADREE